MKIQNSTNWSDSFLRKMTSWVCRQLDMPIRKIKTAQFRNRTIECFSGRAYGGTRFVVSIGPKRAFPLSCRNHAGVANFYLADRTEALINVTAHEVRHLTAAWTGERTRGNGKWCSSSERATEHDAQKVLAAFRERRTELLLEWSVEQIRQVVGTVEKRANKADKDLARWQRKLKLAQTKVRQYRKRVRYYERTLGTAATRGAKP